MTKPRHYFSKNKPVLGDAFRSEEAKEFLETLLKELQDAYRLKHFLTVGYEKYFQEKINDLSNHFYIIEYDTNENDHFSYLQVKRCIDGVVFTVGDKVLDKESPTLRSLPIGRMYEDERGLHIRLDLEPDGKLITWRNLSRIEHDLPF